MHGLKAERLDVGDPERGRVMMECIDKPSYRADLPPWERHLNDLTPLFPEFLSHAGNKGGLAHTVRPLEHQKLSPRLGHSSSVLAP
jgi:hypothetical protein